MEMVIMAYLQNLRSISKRLSLLNCIYSLSQIYSLISEDSKVSRWVMMDAIGDEQSRESK